MPDSLLFDGTDDEIIFSLGGAGFVMGPGTMAAIVKVVGDPLDYVSIFQVGSSTAARNALYRDSTERLTGLYSTAESDVAAITLQEANNWQLIAVTKASGTVAARGHRYVYDSTTWTHSDSASAVADSSTPTTSLTIGDRPGAANNWSGNILIAGVWNTVLSDSAIEALITGTQAWVDAAPLEAWRLDTMSAISSFGTSGTADETSRSGTTLDTGNAPAGWSDLGFVRPSYSRFPKPKLRLG
jgi:hypothetical protein